MANVLPAPSRGLQFPLFPGRRPKLDITTTALWREGLLDDLARTATAARLKRFGDFIDRGMSTSAAFEAARTEMGPEPVALADWITDSLPLSRRCDRRRRGVLN